MAFDRNFKTSYVDIKHSRKWIRIRLYIISKHHMLILNEKSAAIAKLAEWYFKTSYVDIKHLVISGLQFQFINFKTSYVDIKLHSTRYLNYPILHFKTSYVDIKLNNSFASRYWFKFQNIIC